MYRKRLFIKNEEIKKVLEIDSKNKKELYDAYRFLENSYLEVLANHKKLKPQIMQLLSKLFVAYLFATWQIQEPPVTPITNTKVLESFYKKFDISWTEEEPDKEFRNQYFKSKERILLLLGLYDELKENNSINNSNSKEEKIKNAYIFEMKKQYQKAIELYKFANFQDRIDIINKLTEK